MSLSILSPTDNFKTWYDRFNALINVYNESGSSTLKDLSPYLDTGMSIGITSGYIKDTSNNLIEIAEASYDLTSYVPSNNDKIIVGGFNTAGTFTVVEQTEGVTDLPNITGIQPAFMTILSPGQSTITDYTSLSEIRDFVDNSQFYTKTDIDTNIYTKTEIDTDHYTKTEIDADHYTKTDLYTKTEIDTDHYTKTEIDANIYTKTESDSLINNIQDDWVIKTNDYILVAKDCILADTSSNVITLTLPASPSDDDYVKIHDFGSSFNTNNLTVAKNGKTIMGVNEDMVVDLDNISFSLVYESTTGDWRII